INIESDPPGAEVRQGDRVFGVTPRPVSLPRGAAPVHLTFVLEGYEPGGADVTPVGDDTLRVRLTPKAKTRPKAARPAAGTTPQPAAPKPGGEIPPNPY